MGLKTAFLLIGTKQQLKKIDHRPIQIGNELVESMHFARNLGC